MIVCLRIDDPYSYLLLQVLKTFQARFNLYYQFKIVHEVQKAMYPEYPLWQKNAFNDAQYLSKLFNLSFPTSPLNSNIETKEFSCRLVALEQDSTFIDKALTLFDHYWHGNDTELQLDEKSSETLNLLADQLLENELAQKKKGHYLSGSLYFEGEYYWGLDRLHHLEKRLLQQLKSNSQPLFYFHRDQHVLAFNHGTVTKQSKIDCFKAKPIEVYWSLRSPYSYIGLIRVIKLAEHYQTPLVIKPVLPMVMRDLPVPSAKRSYILHDAKREAKKYGIPFGFIADPLGKGVERCYALFDYAKTEGKEINFLKNYATAVWTQGVQSDTDKGLKAIVEKSGLDWLHAKQIVKNQEWRQWANENLAELYAHNLWGVPSFIYNNQSVFGQDRLWLIEQKIVEDL